MAAGLLVAWDRLPPLATSLRALRQELASAVPGAAAQLASAESLLIGRLAIFALLPLLTYREYRLYERHGRFDAHDSALRRGLADRRWLRENVLALALLAAIVVQAARVGFDAWHGERSLAAVLLAVAQACAVVSDGGCGPASCARARKLTSSRKRRALSVCTTQPRASPAPASRRSSTPRRRRSCWET
jgi:hypothetical protein